METQKYAAETEKNITTEIDYQPSWNAGCSWRWPLNYCELLRWLGDLGGLMNLKRCCIIYRPKWTFVMSCFICCKDETFDNTIRKNWNRKIVVIEVTETEICERKLLLFAVKRYIRVIFVIRFCTDTVYSVGLDVWSNTEDSWLGLASLLVYSYWWVVCEWSAVNNLYHLS